MKKTLAIILSLVMVLSILPLSVFAENGPKPFNPDDEYSAYIYCYEVDSDGDSSGTDYVVFDTDESSEFDCPEGMRYDAETNTLYLDNMEYPELVIETNAMGDDFTVYVIGVCSVSCISVWGDAYSGYVRFDGPGKLIVNEDGYSSFGIRANGEESESAVIFGDKVTVEVYGSDFSVGVVETTIAEAAEAIRFENGEEHNIYTYNSGEQTVQIFGFTMMDPAELEEPQSYGFLLECADDPDAIYTGSAMEFTDEETGETSVIYFIIELAYSEEYDTYLPDFGNGENSMAIVPGELLEDAGFTLVLEDGNPVEFINENPVSMDYYMLGVDGDGNSYGVKWVDDEETEESCLYAYDLTEVDGFDGVYYVELNEDVDPYELDIVTEIVEPEDPEEPVYYEHYVEEYDEDDMPFFTYTGTKFPDVPSNAWFCDAAMYNAYNGFIGGYKNGLFGPADALQRQDFVVILARIAGADIDGYTSCKLPDVDMDAYYGKAVAWAVDNGIINGYDDGNFGVGDKITREQVATILYRMMGSPEISDADSILSAFPDGNEVSAFAKNAIAWANLNGIINGKADGTLAPVATASRAEIATIIMRMDKQSMFDL